MNFKNKKITIMGLGLHGGGLSVTKFLVKHGAIVTVTDLKTAQQLAPSLAKLKGLKIKFVLGRHDLADFQQADLIIKNPDVPRASQFLLEARKNNIPIENEASLFFKLCPAQIIAVTGTRGKSTTTTLIYQMIKQYRPQALIAGNIRTVTMFDIISRVKKNTPVVLELSSWQLEELAVYKISPHIGVFTNIMPDHLNRYDGMADYIEAKKAIYKYQTANDYIVINRDSLVTRQLAKEVSGQRFWFSQKLFTEENGCFIKAGKIYFRLRGKESFVAKLSDVKLPGGHNQQNVLAAVAVASIYGVPNTKIVQILRSFSGVPYRQQLLGEYRGIKYYNDTTATTPEATIAALNTISLEKRPLVLLCGGSDKNLDFKGLAKVIKQKVKTLVLFSGKATDKLNWELAKVKYKKGSVLVQTMPQALAEAKKILVSGDTFLLSPGAASFGLFQNEFDRGEQFNKEVAKLK